MDTCEEQNKLINSTKKTSRNRAIKAKKGIRHREHTRVGCASWQAQAAGAGCMKMNLRTWTRKRRWAQQEQQDTTLLVPPPHSSSSWCVTLYYVRTSVFSTEVLIKQPSLLSLALIF